MQELIYSAYAFDYLDDKDSIGSRFIYFSIAFKLLIVTSTFPKQKLFLLFYFTLYSGKQNLD